MSPYRLKRLTFVLSAFLALLGVLVIGGVIIGAMQANDATSSRGGVLPLVIAGCALIILGLSLLLAGCGYIKTRSATSAGAVCTTYGYLAWFFVQGIASGTIRPLKLPGLMAGLTVANILLCIWATRRLRVIIENVHRNA